MLIGASENVELKHVEWYRSTLSGQEGVCSWQTVFLPKWLWEKKVCIT